MRYRLPTFFVAAVREPDGKYRCVVTPVEIPDTGDREADVDTVVAQVHQHPRVVGAPISGPVLLAPSPLETPATRHA